MSAEVGSIDPPITDSAMHSAHYLQLNQLDILLELNTRLLAAQSYKLLNKTFDAATFDAAYCLILIKLCFYNVMLIFLTVTTTIFSCHFI